MADKKATAATSRQSAAPPVEYAAAMDKIRDEMAKSQDNYTRVVGEYLTGYLLKHPEAEAKLLDSGKSIKGSLETVRKEAQKVKVGNMAVLDDQTVFGIVLGYFGIEGTGNREQGTGMAGDASKADRKATSSVTADAVPPSPEGEGMEGRAASPKPSPVGEGGSAPALTDELPVATAPSDPFDLDVLLGVM